MEQRTNPIVERFHRKVDAIIAERAAKKPGGLPDWYEDAYRSYMGMKLFIRNIDGNLELQRKFRDPERLPSRDEVLAAFKNRNDIYYFGLDVKDDIKDDPLEIRNVHEILTKEYVAELAVHVALRIIELAGNVVPPIRILEVGAGDGRLTHHLESDVKELLSENDEDIEIDFVATDLEPPEDDSVNWSKKMDYKSALEKYKPHIAISSWMPYGDDWTADFRGTPSVQEYIMIGEKDGCVGDPFDAESWSDHDDFKGQHIKEAESRQVCYLDEPWADGFKTHSSTMYFRRESRAEITAAPREIRNEALNILELYRHEPEMAKGMVDDIRAWSESETHEPERREKMYPDWNRSKFSDLLNEIFRLAEAEGIDI